MVGEFYIRILLSLHALFTAKEYHHNSSESRNERSFVGLHSKSPMKYGMQFYVHVPLENKKILDAHKILLSGILHGTMNHTSFESPVRWAKAAIDLIRPQRNRTCECFKKLVFCGYNVYAQQKKVSTGDEKSKGRPSIEKEETNYTLWAGKYIDTYGQPPLEYNSCNYAKLTDPYQCDVYAKLRSYLVANIEANHFSNAEAMIIEYRRETLMSRHLIDGNYQGDTKEWAFVGLTQRKLRRSWLNLDDAANACNSAFKAANFVCLEINVETTESPLEQFMMYRSLDVCIGIHGAQLTQAIFMPPASHVLEILPWVPPYTRGDWVKSTRHPTPIGKFCESFSF